jgi:hypothetical protein
MIKKFQMEDNKPMSTPMVTGCKLSLEDDSPKVDETMYRSMVGSFLYSKAKNILKAPLNLDYGIQKIKTSI